MVKNATLLSLSLLFVFVLVLIPIAQAKQNQSREFSVSFKSVKPSSPENDLASKKYFSEQADNGTSAASLLVSHGSVSYPMFADYNGNGYYRKTTYWFDVDANHVVNYYVVYYMDDYDGYGWYTGDGFKSNVFTIENGYSPEEGVYIESFYYFGSKQAKEAIKIELYYEDGTLADTYGPDDNPSLSQVPIESREYDVKKNPFINQTPNPTPTPTPDVAKITGYIIDKDGNDIGNAKVLLKKDGEEIDTVSSDQNGEFVLEGLETGRYELLVSKKGYRKKVAIITIEEDGDDETIVIELKKKR